VAGLLGNDPYTVHPRNNCRVGKGDTAQEGTFRELSTRGSCARGGDIYAAQDATWRAKKQEATEEIRAGQR
jgi:hypothetical protein